MIFKLNGVSFEWDNNKADVVLATHKVSFEEACSVFFDDLALNEQDYREYNEERFFTTGVSNQGRLITVVWTFREPKIRLITAFKATKEQLKRYEQ